MTVNIRKVPRKISERTPFASALEKAFAHCSWKKSLTPDKQEAHGYNAAQPYVLVDLGPGNPARGDSNGYRGLAARVAQKIGARLKVIDYNELIDETPGLESIQDSNWDVRIQHRRRTFFDKEGAPDFLFTRFPGDSADYLGKKGASGIIISAFNEEIPGKLGGDNFAKSPERIPHHLTPEEFAHEGRRFAEEYADLPRPFIGVNLIDHLSHKQGLLAGKLADVASAYDGATIFICTCHRTKEYGYDIFMSDLKTAMSALGANFHVVEFNYNDHIAREDRHDFWNPYKGMLDQADHLVQCGYSGSVISESLSAGKVPYSSDEGEYWSDLCIKKGSLVNLFAQESGKPLAFQPAGAPDVTGECADKLVDLLVRHKEIHNSPATRQDIINNRPADGDWNRFCAHKKSYFTLG